MSNYGKWTFERLSRFSAYDIVVGLNRIFSHESTALVIYEHTLYTDCYGVSDDVAYCRSGYSISTNYISDMELAIEYLKKEYGIIYKEGMKPQICWIRMKSLKPGDDLDSIKPCVANIMTQNKIKEEMIKKLRDEDIYVSPEAEDSSILELFDFLLDLLAEVKYKAQELREEKEFAETQYRQEHALRNELKAELSNAEIKNRHLTAEIDSKSEDAATWKESSDEWKEMYETEVFNKKKLSEEMIARLADLERGRDELIKRNEELSTQIWNLKVANDALKKRVRDLHDDLDEKVDSES